MLSGLLPQMGKRTAVKIVEGEEDEKKHKLLRTEAERQVAAHVGAAQAMAATVLGRWLQAQWDEDIVTSAEERRKRRRSEVLVETGEEEEAMARNLELGRGDRRQRRESEVAEREAERRRRVASGRRPLHWRMAMGPVSERRLREPRWWQAEERERARAAQRARTAAREERQAEERRQRLERVMERGLADRKGGGGASGREGGGRGGDGRKEEVDGEAAGGGGAAEGDG